MPERFYLAGKRAAFVCLLFLGACTGIDTSEMPPFAVMQLAAELRAQDEEGAAKARQLFLELATPVPSRTMIYVPGVGGSPGMVMPTTNPRARPGHAGAMYEYARMLITGNGGDIDVEEGMVWLRKSAAAGHFAAQRALDGFQIINTVRKLDVISTDRAAERDGAQTPHTSD